jgi:hypothetical protein
MKAEDPSLDSNKVATFMRTFKETIQLDSDKGENAKTVTTAVEIDALYSILTFAAVTSSSEYPAESEDDERFDPFIRQLSGKVTKVILKPFIEKFCRKIKPKLFLKPFKPYQARKPEASFISADVNESEYQYFGTNFEIFFYCHEYSIYLYEVDHDNEEALNKHITNALNSKFEHEKMAYFDEEDYFILLAGKIPDKFEMNVDALGNYLKERVEAVLQALYSFKK